MKIEETENSIKLIPENEYEREKLKRLQQRGVEKVQFEDAWNSQGALILHHHTHPWDTTP